MIEWLFWPSWALGSVSTFIWSVKWACKNFGEVELIDVIGLTLFSLVAFPLVILTVGAIWFGRSKYNITFKCGRE